MTVFGGYFFGLIVQIECEPEYLMEEFGTNPDIDEKPPIPLRDALEKMKPFLMAYEGIQSQEEWEVLLDMLLVFHCCQVKLSLAHAIK